METEQAEEQKKTVGYDFDFHIDGLDEENAERLYNICIFFAEALGLDIGGGFFSVMENEDVTDKT